MAARHEGEGLARLALVVAAAGTWPSDRCFKAGLVSEDLCQRCFEAPEDGSHRIWQCPASLETDDERIRGSQGLAIAGREKHKAFWTRGLIPQSWVPIQLPTDVPCTVESGL